VGAPGSDMVRQVVERVRAASRRAREYVAGEVRERTGGLMARAEERLASLREGYKRMHATLTYHSTALTVAGTGLSGAAAWFSYTGRALHQSRLEHQLQQLHEDFATLHMKDVPKEVAKKVRQYEQEQEVTAWSVAWYQVPLLPLAAGLIYMGGYRAGGNAARAAAARRVALQRLATTSPGTSSTQASAAASAAAAAAAPPEAMAAPEALAASAATPAGPPASTPKQQ